MSQVIWVQMFESGTGSFKRLNSTKLGADRFSKNRSALSTGFGTLIECMIVWQYDIIGHEHLR